jgi:SAM-dependent MidA family methyltransferase
MLKSKSSILTTFESYMEYALYGENGFYAKNGSSGRRMGDFLTSPEVGPLFGEVVAGLIDEVWIDLGRPKQFDFVECGAGRGTLARSILAARPKCIASLNYVAVEISDSQRKLHPSGVVSVRDMPDGPINGIIFANELLDNIPFRLFVFDGRWKESCVIEEESGKFVEVLRSTDENLDFLPKSAPHGSRAPLQDRAGRWVQTAVSKLNSGKVVLIDYCSELTSEICNTPWRNWLRTYKSHERGSHYLNEPGSQDITAQVLLDQLRRVVPIIQVESQSAWLTKHGIESMVQEGREYWDAHRSIPDLTTMKMLSRVSEATVLLDETGLGGFSVLTINVRD